jgi:hypothetical protein
MSINLSKNEAEFKPRMGFEEILSILSTLQTILSTHNRWTLHFRQITQTDEVFLTIMGGEPEQKMRPLSYVRCSVQTMDILKEHGRVPKNVNFATKCCSPLDMNQLWITS